MILTRRQFLTLAPLAIGTAAGLAYTAKRDTTEIFEVNQIRVGIEDLPPSFNDYRIGFVSDIHHGVYLRDEYLADVLSAAQSAKPDLLVLGGDYSWIPETPFQGSITFRNNKLDSPYRYQSLEAIYHSLNSVLQTITPADGIVAVLGNHDHWNGAKLCISALRSGKSPPRFLINETLEIRRGDSLLSLYGIDDYWTGAPRIPTAFTVRKATNEARVVISHNPDTLSWLLKVVHFDLGLAGHTHGGQIRLPQPLGPVVRNIEDPRFFEGLVNSGNASIYTTRGIGTVEIPYRINCPGEVTVLNLERA